MYLLFNWEIMSNMFHYQFVSIRVIISYYVTHGKSQKICELTITSVITIWDAKFAQNTSLPGLKYQV